jgi:hypothetical protein
MDNSMKNFEVIELPYLDRHNDIIEIYEKPFGQKHILLTDDSYTLIELEMAGISYDS